MDVLTGNPCPPLLKEARVFIEIVYDPLRPERQGTVVDEEPGMAKLLIREGRARPAQTLPAYTAGAPEPGPVATAPMIAVSRRRRSTEKEGEPQ